MSKAVKRKVSVELQKPSSKSRLSVFQRLGTKKSKSLSESKSLTDDFKQTLSAAVSITTKPILSKPDAVELEDADPDILEKKREEIRKELELQMKMESRRVAARKRKHETTSSSSSSGSDSESSSSTSSSSSSDNRKTRKMKSKRRDSSSSSDEYAKKLAKKKRACQSKKEAMKLHKLSKKHELIVRKSKKHSPSPVAKKHRSDSSSIMLSPSGQKLLVKNLKISTTIDKHHRIREKEIDRNELLQRSERERMRIREEHIRSRSPKLARTRSRTPKRERSPVMRRSPSDKRNRSLSRRMDTEHERRERDREIAREKERREALLRCQERQKERERMAKDSKSQRLLPRPAERAMALAAAQERNTDKDVPYSNRSFGDRPEFEHRRLEKETREHDRSYEKYESHNRREPSEYQHTSSYRRDWHDDNSTKDLYERPTEHQNTPRDWEHKRSDNIRPNDYPERKDWNESAPKWADSRKPTEKYERRGPNEYPQHGNVRNYADRSETFDPNSSGPVSKPIGGGIRGRWNSWRGRGRGGHHSDFRRTHHHTEILEERGEIYRRHINPQGANSSKPATITKPSDSQSMSINEKANDEPNKSMNADDNADAEEIADDLSEISDEADDILGQQEDINAKPQTTENIAEKKIDDEYKESAQQTRDANCADSVEKLTEPIESAQIGGEQLARAKSPEEPDRTKDLSDDIDLDFEEISDGELEEEARTKGLGDALGVDWASLVEESKALMREKLNKTETSVKQLWHPDQILLDIGISYKMAGTDFAQQTLINAYENVKKEMKTSVTIKTEPIDDVNHMEANIKMENDIENGTKGAKVNGKHENEAIEKIERNLILHPLPCVQTSTRTIAEKKRRLIFNATGPYSRGLCTKRDIEMRRQLCNLAINENNCKIATNRSGYENIALKLFQKTLQT